MQHPCAACRTNWWRALTVVALVLYDSSAYAESVFVKYRGPVDLAPFTCQVVTQSSLVQRVCYDAPNQYMLISLKGTYYHYCRIGAATVDGLLTADSMGQFYNASIKGRLDCRQGGVPEYH